MIRARVRARHRSLSIACAVAMIAAVLVVVAAPSGIAAPYPWTYDTAVPLATVDGSSGPAPFVVDYDDDGDLDLLVGWRYPWTQGGISVYLRGSDGTLGSPQQVLTGGSASTPFPGATYYHRPVMVDWNGDGKSDLIYGQYNQQGVAYCPNTGSSTSPVFDATTCTLLRTSDTTLVGATSDNRGYTSPEVVDWDNDTDLDLLVGSGYVATERGVRLYTNTGTATDGTPILGSPTWIRQQGDSGLVYETMFEPDVIDINDDGMKDLLIGGVSYVRQCINTGTDAAPTFGYCGYYLPAAGDWTVIDFTDWDGDGLVDLVRGDFDYPSTSNLILYGRVPIEDADGDGVVDGEDNCPTTPNPADMKLDNATAVQIDTDGDGDGDACDDDLDGDTVPNAIDNCPWTVNPTQADADGDGRGAACDPKDQEPGYGSYEWQQANRMEWGRKPVILMRVDALSQSYRYDIATQLIDTALAKDVPITIAVIPWNDTVFPPTASATWLTANAPDADLEIAQHGTYHRCVYTDGVGTPEFGCGMDEGRSFNLMRVGYDSMYASITSTPSRTYDGFVPPEDGFDAGAMEAIRSLGYRYLASGFYRYSDPDLAGIEMFEPDATGLVHVPWTQAACGNESAPWLTTYCDPLDGTAFPDTEPGGLLDRVAAELVGDGISSIIYEVASYDLPSSLTPSGGGWNVTYTGTPDPAAMVNFGAVLDGLKAFETTHDAIIMTLGEYAAAVSITDEVDPVVTITSPTATEYTADLDITLAFSATDALSGIHDVSADLDGVTVTNGSTIDLASLSTGSHTLTVVAEDMAGNSASETVTFTVVKRPTTVTYTGATSGQYSDTVSLSATLTDDATTPLASKAVTFTLGTQSTSATTDAFGVASTTLTLAQPQGSYTVSASFAGDTEYASDTDSTSFAISAEDTTVSFDGANPSGVPVTVPGSDESEPFQLIAHIGESDPASMLGVGPGPGPGDLTLGDWTIGLVPVGPGGPESPSSCTPVLANGVLTLTCSFGGVPVNTYEVVVTDRNGFFDVDVTDVVTVYDPSLGFATGGGWFTWPGTEDKTNFGFSMKYNKKGSKVQGSLLIIRHTDDGNYRIKSNALYGLALGGDASMGWASFSGKATYSEPTWLEAVGNHEFTVYVEDRDGSGPDRIWLQLTDKDRVLIADLSMMGPASGNSVPIVGGNVVVPHDPSPKGGGR